MEIVNEIMSHDDDFHCLRRQAGAQDTLEKFVFRTSYC